MIILLGSIALEQRAAVEDICVCSELHLGEHKRSRERERALVAARPKPESAMKEGQSADPLILFPRLIA